MSWCIYKHTNKINGKVYIGQTCHIDNPNLRWQNGCGYSPLFPFGKAIDKYGWDAFSHEIIENNIPSQEAANEREVYWIAFYHSYVKDTPCNGYNATRGGDNRDHLGREIYQLDPNNYFILQKWITISLAARELDIDHRSIQRACEGEYRHAGGFCWCYVEDYSEGWQVREDNDKQMVICLETNEEYESINEASRKTGIVAPSISRVCRYQQNKAGGLTWRYKFHDDPQHISQTRQTASCRPVCCLEDKKRFISVAEAARYYTLDASGITKCCRGKLRSTGGRHFYYDGDSPSFAQATYGAKPCECLDTGEQFSSASSAARKTGICMTSIAKACSEKQQTAGGLRWRYLSEEEKEFYFRNYIIDYSSAALKNKKVRCLELEKTFSSPGAASTELGIGSESIRKSCSGTQKTAGGYHWEYVE